MSAYTYPKKNFIKQEDVEEMRVVFSNGDYLHIAKKEITEVSVLLCDRLRIRGEQIQLTAGGGYIKCRIDGAKAEEGDRFLHNGKAYDADRRRYIAERCATEGEIDSLQLIDEMNWCHSLHGHITAMTEGAYLCFRFAPAGETQGEEAFIHLNNICRGDVWTVTLGFENCQSCMILCEEIAEMQLSFEKELCHSGDELRRQLKGGYMLIDLDKRFYNRSQGGWPEKQASLRYWKKRICGKHISEHDVCYLHIRHVDRIALFEEESIDIPDIRPDEELERIWQEEENDPTLYVTPHIGGYAKRLKGNRIVIAFGKKAEHILSRF